MGVAAYGVVANFALVATAIFNGVAQGAQPLVSRCYGQNDHMAGAGNCFCWAAAPCWPAGGGVVRCRVWLYRFAGGPGSTAKTRCRWRSTPTPGCGCTLWATSFAGFNIVAAGYLSATNRPVEASVTSICRGIVAIVACSLVLSALCSG